MAATDEIKKRVKRREEMFLRRLFGMLAKMAKADGKVDAWEAHAAEKAFERFPRAAARRKFCIRVFNEAKNSRISLAKMAWEFANKWASPEDCLAVYEILWDIACSTGVLRPVHKCYLECLCRFLHLPESYFDIYYRKRHGEFREWTEEDEKRVREARYRAEAAREEKAHRTSLFQAEYNLLGCLPIGPEAAIPYATVARVAWTCAATAVSTYNDYEDLVGSIESQAGERVFSFETSKLDRLHEQNKQLLDDQWRLIRKHGLDDALRVSDADIKQLISFLKDEDHERVYSLIEPMREKFKMFPDYWYYLSCVAMETQRNEIGLEACETFFRINRGLFRDDPMVGGVALNKAFMLPKTEENKAEVKRCLELSEKHNSGCTDWRRDYLAAIIWAEYLKDSKRAEKVIAHAVSSLEVKIKEVLQRAGGEMIDSALGESLWVCRRLAEKLGKEGLAADDAHLRSLCQQMLTSSVEKLYYLGRMRAADVWAVMKDDVLKVSLDMNSELSAKGDAKVIQATLPVSWFLTGGLELNLSVFQGEVRLKEIPETINHRRANVGRTISVGFEIDKADLEKADSFRLDLKHPEYPVFFTFASATPYGDADKAGIAGKLHVFEGKLSAGNLAKDLFLYTVSFCGTSYHWDPSSGRLADRKYSSKADPAGWASSFMGVFENLEPIKEVNKRDKGLVKSLTYDAAKQAFTLRYENTSDKPIKPAVSLYFLNRYGSVTARFDDAWFWKSIAPGESHEQIIPAGVHGKPYYVDVEDGTSQKDK